MDLANSSYNMEMYYLEANIGNQVVLNLLVYQRILFLDAFSSKRVSARAFTTFHCEECG